MDISTLINVAQNGSGHYDAAISIARVATGTFFAISGFNKLTDPGRHQSLVETLSKDHVPDVKFMEWWVPGWELIAGTLLALGLFTSFAALVLIIICAVACCCEAKGRVDAYQPINGGDRVADYLYLPEVLYMLLLVVPALAGGGAYSLDAVLQ